MPSTSALSAPARTAARPVSCARCDDVVGPREIVRQLARQERARAVGAVAADAAARVDDDRSPPRPILRSPGTACGDPPVGPAATIGGKESSSPPASCRSDSIRHASSRSARPTNGSSAKRANASFAAAAARRIGVELGLVLDGPHRLDEARVRGELEPAGRRAARTARSVSAAGSNSTRRLDERRQLGVDVAPGHDELDVRHLPGALGVAEVREQARPLGLDQQRRVRAREAGQVADVDEARDEERRLDRLLEPREPSSCALRPGTRAPRGIRPGPCRRCASRPGRR